MPACRAGTYANERYNNIVTIAIHSIKNFVWPRSKEKVYLKCHKHTLRQTVLYCCNKELFYHKECFVVLLKHSLWSKMVYCTNKALFADVYKLMSHMMCSASTTNHSSW